jgi:hypothetical protein
MLQEAKDEQQCRSSPLRGGVFQDIEEDGKCCFELEERLLLGSIVCAARVVVRSMGR